MLLTSGMELGRYLLDHRIGTGGMAEVWLALDQSLERHVAIKVMAQSVAEDPVFVQRFLREARLTARLEHPHILPVYDFGFSDTVLFLVMPLMHKGTLRQRIKSGIDPATAVAWTKHLASALDFAHGEGVVHRDVKPANVLIDKAERVMLGDFGLARARSSEPLTIVGTAVGTPVYMSPEQVRGEEADARSDQYSLGVLAFYLLTGFPPFEANSSLVIMTKTLHEEPNLPSSLKEGFHRSVDYVLLKVLEKKREDRFPDCLTFANALEKAIERTLKAGRPEARLPT